MNIYAIKGHKVKYLGINGGDYAREHANKHLEIGKEYTVDHTDVGQSSTSVYFEEVPNQSFNSVMFEDVEPQSEEQDKQHLDWKMWNS
jgi:hypothetical protein